MSNIDSLTPTDIIQIVGIVVSLITSVVAIIISIVAVRQNSKMIEESNRPYVAVYFDYTQTGEPTGYFIVKNFGSAPATIDSFTYNESIAKHPTTLSNLPAIFDGLVGNAIAPGQKFFAPFKLYEYVGGTSIFNISYHSGRKKYSEHFEISVSNYGKLVKPRLVSDVYKPLSYPLQEISERLM